MSRNLDDIFNECYERIRFGESLESVLRSYPQYRSQLEPLLRTTFDIGRRASFIQPRPEFKHWARVRFESAMQYPRQPQQMRQPARVETPSASMWLRHGWAVIVSVGIVLMLGVGSTMAASSDAMPTEPLYPVKIATENVQRAFAVTPEAKANFETDVANIRAAELQAMADVGNTQEAAKAAVRYDDQFERAVEAIIEAEGTEPLVTAPIPPVQTTPTTPSPAAITPPATPEVTPPAQVTPTPELTPTPEVTTPPVVQPSDNETQQDTVQVPPAETDEQPATGNQPQVTQPSEPVETPATVEGTTTSGNQPSATGGQPSTTTDSTKSSRGKELRDKLNAQRSTLDQSLKDAQDKAEHKDKSDWQDIRDKIKSKKAAVSDTSNSQTTTGSDNKTAPSSSGNNKPSSSNHRR